MNQIGALRISEISKASPDMDDLEFAELKADIQRRGQLLPIWTCKGEVIDGRKRLRVCHELGVAPKIVETETEDPAGMATALNILRTHYTESQRAMFAAKMANLVRGNIQTQRKQGDALVAKFSHQILSSSEAAKLAGVSTASIKTAKLVRREGAPEVVEAVEAGEITLHSAKRIVKEVSIENQAAAVNATKCRPKRSDGKVVGERKLVSVRHASLATKINGSLEQLENIVEWLGEFLGNEQAGSSEEVQRWVDKLTKARSSIGVIIKKLRR